MVGYELQDEAGRVCARGRTGLARAEGGRASCPSGPRRPAASAEQGWTVFRRRGLTDAADSSTCCRSDPPMPTVAIASEFLDAFARIPRAQQRKVREFTEKFKANPKSAGHQLREDPRRQGRQGPHRADRPEVPGRHPAPDRGRRVRPGLGGQPRRGDGLGQEARVFEVNPVTGSLQVFNVSEAEQAVAREKQAREPRPARRLRRRRAAVLRRAGRPAAGRAGGADPGRTCSPWSSTCPPRRPRR